MSHWSYWFMSKAARLLVINGSSLSPVQSGTWLEKKCPEFHPPRLENWGFIKAGVNKVCEILSFLKFLLTFIMDISWEKKVIIKIYPHPLNRILINDGVYNIHNTCFMDLIMQNRFILILCFRNKWQAFWIYISFCFVYLHSIVKKYILKNRSKLLK